MQRTIEDLKEVRSKLVERRRKEAYWLRSPHDDSRIASLSQIQIAIDAIDAVIAEGASEAESAYTLDNL